MRQRVLACAAIALFTGAITLLLLSCGSGGGSESAASTVKPTSAPTRTPIKTTAVRGVCLPDEPLAPAVAACEDIAERLDAPPGDVGLVSVTDTEWPDSCLGAAETNEVCAQVITPGYEITLQVVSRPGAYIYHTDQGFTVRLASITLNPLDSDYVELGLPERVVLASEPVAFDFTPDGRLLYTERRLGEIRVVDLAAGTSNAAGSDGLFAEVETFVGSECGLLGIAVDPDFSANHYVYVYVTQPVPERTDVGKPRLIRFTDVAGTGSNSVVLVDDLPFTNSRDCAHVGGNVHFGPDGYLYLSLGNFERPSTAPDLRSPIGKILRLDKADGSAAPGNPFANQPPSDERVFAYGLRNPWDFAFHPQTGKIYAPDNGPGTCDELNLIEPGADYGVPGSLVSEDTPSCLGLGGIDPIYAFSLPGFRPEQAGSNVAPTGVAFVSGETYPELGDGLLVCEFLTRTLRHLALAGAAQDEVRRDVVVSNDCQFSVRTDAEGLIYYSNAGGIYRLPPP